ncbi:MAG: hypothetical protein HYX69_22830 [Planctomycetia bacterium]|nr:hypothetical protein [Planctomycetia bacterium]
MRLGTFVGVVILLVLGASASAAKLVVMGVNLRGPAPAGQKVYTIGVDLEGQSGHLGIQLENFFIGTGSGGSPKQGNFEAPFDGGGDNPATLQDAQTLAQVFGAVEFQQYDSWWYASSTGDLRDAKNKVITSDPIVGSYGYLWEPFVTGATGGTGPEPELGSGTTVGFIGLYGPVGPTPIASTPIVPLVQLRVAGSISLRGDANPFVAFISLIDANGTTFEYNILGGSKFTDAQAILDFNTDTIHAIPEPRSLALAGAAVLWFVVPRRKPHS